MKTLTVGLRNCHGIRELDATFAFDKGNAVAVYAPNGTMKTSFARTLKDLAAGQETTDHMFPGRETRRSASDENGDDLDPRDVVVVLSYDEDLGPTESTSTLLVNAELRKEYEGLQTELFDARDQLVAALKAQSGTRQDVARAVSRAIMQGDDKFFEALVRVAYEVEQLTSAPFAELPYDLLFNDKVDAILRSPALQADLADYVERLNELLDASEFFSRDSFSFYNATMVTKSLGDNGFFAADHSLLLHGEDTPRPVTSQADLNALIAEEKKSITDDDALRKRLEAVEKALQKNVDTRRFFDFIAGHEELLPELAHVDSFQQNVWISYLKKHEDLYERAVKCFKDTEARRKEIERQAAAESTQWEKVIKIFNDRFFVPFRLSAGNKHRVMLGQEAMLKLVFEFEEGGETTGVERDDLLSVLSNGEKKALYILNVLFEMEARKAAGRETLFVIDDLADSFDYKNKYAIVQYLREMADHANFKLVLLTHNFDFFRTLVSRGVVPYNRCFMAQKGDSKSRAQPSRARQQPVHPWLQEELLHRRHAAHGIDPIRAEHPRVHQGHRRRGLHHADVAAPLEEGFPLHHERGSGPDLLRHIPRAGWQGVGLTGGRRDRPPHSAGRPRPHGRRRRELREQDRPVDRDSCARREVHGRRDQ